MSFLWPVGLLALLLVPIGAGLASVIERQRRRRLAGLGSLGRPGATGGRRSAGRVAGTLLLLAFVLLGIAMGRPQATVAQPTIEGTVILAFDVSASMAATDVEPSRLEAAKAVAKDFVSHAPPGVVIGIVAFSEAGAAVQPPTNDLVAVSASIDRLEPAQGTSLGQGILAALTAVARAESDTPADYYSNRSPAPTPTPAPVPPGSHGSALVVLFSDGESNAPPDPATAAQAAANLGIRVDTVGIGTANGIDIKLDGFSVHTQLDDTALRAVADATDGTYFTPDDTAGLQAVFGAVSPLLVLKSQPIEITGLVAVSGLLLLGVASLISLAWLGRLP
jgi:Ca-activated chloride channel family protein